MKKSIALVLLAVLVSSSVAPATAQKRTAAGLRKKQDLTAGSPSTQFADVRAHTDGTGVYLTWQMEAEIGNIGFHVYRVSKHGVEMLSPEKLVGGAALHGREVPSYGQTYEFYDVSGDGDAAYYVEAISLDGSRIRTREIYPAFTSDLSAVSGRTSAELKARVSEPARFEQSILTYTKEIVNEMEDSRLAPDPVTHRSVISQTGVVRIGVKNEGLHRVPRAQLEAAGFNVNSDSSMWQLYVEGVEQSIIIGNNADYIEFYGKGTNTPETDIRQYYLMNGTSPGKRIDTRVAHPNTSTVVTPSYLQTFVKEENTSYIDDVDNGPLENYFGRGFGATQTTMAFNLSGVDFAIPTSALQLRFQGYSTGAHQVEVILNDHVLAPVPGPAGEASFTGDFSIPTSFLLEGANNIKFRAVGSAGDFIFFDTMSIAFSRKFLADQNKLSFYTQNYRIARLDGFGSANVRVFDLTYDGSPTLMTNLTFQQNGSAFGVNMPAARGRAFYAVEDSAILAPHSVTPNNPELVGVPTNGADLVIISYKDFLPQAEAWANYRRGPGQGFTVKVIEVSELFDEFSYGALSSTALSSFFQYAHQNWQNPPEYALLIGDASVDSRNYENQGYWNMVPSKIVSAVFSETASDEALADFDNDGLAEIPIGRIASRTSAGVTTVFDKVVHWEAYTSPWTRGALFAYDHNVGYDFDGMSLRVRNQLPGDIPATMVYRGEVNANANLVAAMNAGKYIVNYAGHGTTGSWGGSPVFFNILTVPTLEEDPDNPALYTMLTCLNGAYHYLFNESFAEVLTKSPNRGAVAAWASTGLTLPNIQERMATRFYLKIGEGNTPRIGDLIRDAKSVLTIEDGGADVRRSWSLIGDPMLKVR
jgi:hypothetical protein